MIGHQVKRHDRYQLELKFTYPVVQDVRRSDYTVDTFLFLPSALDINPGTYTSDDFFHDLKTNIRLKTPVCNLHDLKGSCPYVQGLEQAVQLLPEGLPGKHQETDQETDFEHRLKLFCSVYNRALEEEARRISEFAGENLPHEMEAYQRSIRDMLQWFRHTIGPLASDQYSYRVRIAVTSADEYLSLRSELQTLAVLAGLKQRNVEGIHFQVTSLTDLCGMESAYRKTRGMGVTVDANTNENTNENEAFIHRKSILKKYFSSALFLQGERRNGGVLLEQTLMGFAAGLAMLFATVLAFYFQRRFGNLTLPFLVGLVTSYIFKDRIKELTRLYMIRKARRFVHDRKTNLRDRDDRVVGKLLESVFFLKEISLPEDVRRIRSRDHVTELANLFREESVLQYRKKIYLFRRQVSRNYPDNEMAGITEITRLNVSRFLSKMDDPEKPFLMLRDGKVKLATGRRIYKVNMIVAISDRHRTLLYRYRLILDRRGIRRVEAVQPVLTTGSAAVI